MANFIRGGTRIYATPPVSLPSTTLTVDRKADGEQPAKGDNYLSALLKLIPAEIVTVYLATKDTASAHNQLTLWFSLCLGTCFIFRMYSNLPDKTNVKIWDVQWRAVIVSTIAFSLWAFATAEQGKPPLAFLNIEPWLAGAVASLFGLLAPLVVPADPQQK